MGSGFDPLAAHTPHPRGDPERQDSGSTVHERRRRDGSCHTFRARRTDSRHSATTRSGAHRDGGVLTIGTRGHQRRDSTSRRVPVVTPTIFSVSASLRLAQLWVSWTGWRICEPLVSISIFP